MSEKNFLIGTGLVILALFGYGFNFGGSYTEQIALLVSGFLLGNLFTVADYAGDNND